jgi:hypothetical protein
MNGASMVALCGDIVVCKSCGLVYAQLPSKSVIACPVCKSALNDPFPYPQPESELESDSDEF